MFSGYFSARIFKAFRGISWRTNAFWVRLKKFKLPPQSVRPHPCFPCSFSFASPWSTVSIGHSNPRMPYPSAHSSHSTSCGLESRCRPLSSVPTLEIGNRYEGRWDCSLTARRPFHIQSGPFRSLVKYDIYIYLFLVSCCRFLNKASSTVRFLGISIPAYYHYSLTMTASWSAASCPLRWSSWSSSLS